MRPPPPPPPPQIALFGRHWLSVSLIAIKHDRVDVIWHAGFRIGVGNLVVFVKREQEG
jgi:hypothetical protein